MDAQQRHPSWIVAISLAAIGGTAGWMLTACLVPYVDAGTIEYVLLVPPFARLGMWWAGGAVLVALLYAFPGGRPAALPIALLAFVPFSVILLATPLARYAAPWLYVAFDLRWWLLATVAALILAGRRSTNGEDMVALTKRVWQRVSRKRGLADAALIVLLAGSSLLTSPPLRFQSVLIGDEPKYLRYVENWYRGRGMDIAGLSPIADLPADTTSNLGGNLLSLPEALRRAAADLAGDARRRLGLHAPPPPGPAQSGGGWFVGGKRGGIYQVHNPGLSVLLLPGYVIDRAASRTQAWHPQFPTDLYASSLTLLLIYVLWGWAVFRLVSMYSGRAVLSWPLTAVVMLSLPACAFAYQYYPEAAAGLVIALLTRHLLAPPERAPARAVAYGLLTGFLPWLHVRFLLFALITGAAVAWTRRRMPGTAAWFTTGLALPLLCLGVYYYHVAGTPMPWALYALTPGELFLPSRAWRDLPAFWFDRTWGLVGHAPVFVFALAGLWIAWRQHPRAVLAGAAAILGVAIPSAGVGYNGAFTTPTRLVAAFVPLLALPITDALLSFWRSPWFTASFVFAAVVSVQNGLTYSANFIKSQSSMQATTLSGWLSLLLLPDFNSSRLDQPLTIIWLGITGAILALPLLARTRWRSWQPGWPLVAAIVIGGFAAAGSLGAALSGIRTSPNFALRPGDARDRLVHSALTDPPWLAWTSERGRIDLHRFFPNPEGTVTTVRIEPERPKAGREMRAMIDARRPGNRPGWGTAFVDFADGSRFETIAIEGSGGRSHSYRGPGDYRIRIDIELWGLPMETRYATVHVEQ